MYKKKAMTDQSMLWGFPVPVLDLWGLRFMFFGAALGAAALLVSLASSFVLYKVADKVQAEADQRIAETNAEAAKANEHAKSLEKAVAEANARQKEAELKLALLEKKIIPRVINSEGALAIVEKLKPFPPMPFAIESDLAAEYDFVNRLVELLQQVGWKWKSYSTSLVTLPMGNIGMPSPDGSGVQIRINRALSADFMSVAQALALALTGAIGAGVGLVVDPTDSPVACSPDAIHIEIRRKL